MSGKPKSHRRLFLTRRLILPPTPASDILIPIFSVFLIVILGTMTYTMIPLQQKPIANYQKTRYEFYPPEDNIVSIIAHQETSVSGQISYRTSTWTFDKTSKTPYRLAQIFRDQNALAELTNKPISEEALQTSFAIDRANQELITSLEGTEQRIKFTDLEGKLSFEFSQPMFGINPFTYKTPDNIDCAVEKCLALTFDDGPSDYTSRLLDILDYSHAKATFFVQGFRVSSLSAQIARAARAGHDIGSHSWVHRNLPQFSYSFILSDLTSTTNVIQSASGQLVKFFRPPYGNLNTAVRNAAAALGQQIVLWTIDPWDWQYRDATYVCSHVIDRAKPNAVILLHDVYPTSIDAAQCIINHLSSDYTFVNLSTLYK